MSQLLINQVLITYPKDSIDIFFKPGKDYKFSRVFTIDYLLRNLNNTSTDFASYLNSIAHQNSHVSIKFEKEEADNELKQFTFNLEKEPFFIPLYLSSKFKSYFQHKEFITASNFIDDLEIWEKKQPATTDDYYEYNVWNLKIDKQFDKYYLTIGLGSQNSKIHKQSISELNLEHQTVKKVLLDKEIFRTKFLDEEIIKTGKPLLNREIDSNLRLSFASSKDFSFINHYSLITTFYESHLKGKDIARGVQVLASGLRELKESEIIEIPREKNLLEFGEGKTEYDPYRGFSNYGPYFVPEDVDKVKFIFIYSKTDKDIANSLYKYFKYGYRHFPGLESFSKIPFDLDIENSISFESSNTALEQIEERLKSLTLDSQRKYVALYISPFSEETANEDEKLIYFKIKESLLNLNITSQVIESIKLKSQAIHFYLPNMAIAILAKVGGIPWKLKRDLGNCLLVGFGEKIIKSPGGTRYIGNTVCFNNSGVFKDLSCFEYTQENLKKSLEDAINNHIVENGEPQKLIIHYFKEWGNKESATLAEVFKNLNLNIPYTVLNINDTRAKDYICFDKSYPGKIPVSGTVVELKKSVFILFNNERHSDDISTYKGDDKYPVKITITAHNGVDIRDKNEVIDLLDQVYEFSRLYWRSIKQKAVPVTIEYAKELSEKAYYFSNGLPNSKIAKKTLWFI